MLSKTAMGIAAGAGLCFLGYCVYFDRKRRSDPDFKRKLRESKLSMVFHVHFDLNFSMPLFSSPCEQVRTQITQFVVL